MFDLKAHLKTLVETHAPSGHEAPIREVIREAWLDLVNDFDRDKLGSLIGIKRATLPNETQRKIMLAAHLDEIGLMVRDIVDGFIFVHRISGIDNRVMLAQPVIVHGKKQLPGVVAAVPPHLLTASDRKKYPSFDQLVIDVGLSADDVNDLVTIGDLITPEAPMLSLNGQHVASKSMDNRASVAAVTFALNELRNMQHSWDVYATATVQEESGLYGAATSAFYIQPDIAIALDVTFGEQPGISSDDALEMNGGTAIGLGANFHPKLFDKIVDVAKQYEIKHQIEPMVGNSGTDAVSIQISRAGIPTALLSIPTRNMHSPVETLNLKDIERTGRLLAQFITSLDNDFMSAIEWDEMQTESEG